MTLRSKNIQKLLFSIIVSLAIIPVLLSGGCAAASSAEKEPAQKTVNWRMATSWPGEMYYHTNAAVKICERVKAMSAGKFVITPYPADKLMGAYDVFDGASSGKLECMHSWPGYWRSKEPACELFSSITNHLMAQEYAVWLYGPAKGIDLWKELYAKYNMIPFPGGMVGPEFGFFTNKPVRSLDDFKGMTIRVTGIAADVLTSLGATTVSIPPGQIADALKKGEIDGFEFSSPYVDWQMGFANVARYVLLPSWHQPSAMFETCVNASAWQALPAEYRAIFESACKEVAMVDVTAELEGYGASYKKKYEDAGITITVLDFEDIKMLSAITDRIADQQAAKDAFYAKILKSQREFRTQYRTWELWGDYNMYPEKR